MSYWMSICALVLAAYAPRWGPKSVIFKAFWRFDVVRAEVSLGGSLGALSGLSGALLGLSGALWGSLELPGAFWRPLELSGAL